MKTIVNRKRNRAVTIRLTDAEYKYLKNRVRKAGISQQTFIINAIQGSNIMSNDEVHVLKEISKTFADLTRQLRGLSTNVNQMAHIANGWNVLPTERELNSIFDQIQYYREESDKIWLLIRSLINQRRVTEP